MGNPEKAWVGKAAITRQISKAVSKRLDDPDKQPVGKPYKKEEHDGYVFCCADAYTKVRKVVAAGVDDGWRGCCIVNCKYWLCSSGNCQKQMKTHIKGCLEKKIYSELHPFVWIWKLFYWIHCFHTTIFQKQFRVVDSLCLFLFDNISVFSLDSGLFEFACSSFRRKWSFPILLVEESSRKIE